MNYPVAMIGIEPMLIVLVLVLLLFGGKKIPELLHGVGKGVGELQKGLEECKRQLATSIQESAQPTVTPVQTAAPVTPEHTTSTTGTPPTAVG